MTVDSTMNENSPGYLSALWKETSNLETRVNTCKSKILVETSFMWTYEEFWSVFLWRQFMTTVSPLRRLLVLSVISMFGTVCFVSPFVRGMRPNGEREKFWLWHRSVIVWFYQITLQVIKARVTSSKPVWRHQNACDVIRTSCCISKNNMYSDALDEQ